MKRPLVLVGFCYLLTLAAAVYLGEQAAAVLFGLCLAGFAFAVSRAEIRKAVVLPLAFATAAVALGSFCLYSRFAVDPPQALDGKEEEVRATVCELPYRQYGRWYFTVRIDDISEPGAPKNFKVRLSAQNGLEVEPYSHIRGRVHLFLPSSGDGFSSRSYYASKGVFLFGYIDEYEGVTVSPPDSAPPYALALRMRQAMLRSVDSMLAPEEAGLVKGVFLGDQTGLSTQAESDFRVDGISHLLSVSGLHMATVAGLLLLLLSALRLPKKLSALLAAAGVFGFMAVTGFVPSVARSGLMCLLFLAAPLFSRQADSLNSLGIATLIICLLNPYAAADVGLLLSVSATLGLILLSGRITAFLNVRCEKLRLLNLLTRGVNGVLATTVAATLFTLPIIILTFGSVSVVAPLSNLLELVQSSLMISFAAFGAVLNLIFPQSLVAMPFAIAAGLLSKYMLICARWLAQIPFAAVSASYGFVKLWLAGTLLLFAAALFLSRTNRLLRSAAWLSAIVLLVGILSYQTSMYDVVRIAVLDVGTAESVAVTCNGHAAVIGCGGFNSNAIVRYLNSQSVQSIDYLQLLTQEHDEAANSADLAARFPITQVVAQRQEQMDGFVRKARQNAQQCCLYQASAQAGLWERVRIETRSCGKSEAARLTAYGVSVLLLPDGADAASLPQDWLSSDFLVTDALSQISGGAAPARTVFSLDAQDLEKAGKLLQKPGCARTGGQGSVVLELRGERMLSIRRET